MTVDQVRRIGATLNSLPFVTWDRFVEIPDGDIDVFGWIARADERSDFVTLTFKDGDPAWVGFTTSSDDRSAEIGRLLHGTTDAEYVPCQRVERAFAEIVERKVVLS